MDPMTFLTHSTMLAQEETVIFVVFDRLTGPPSLIVLFAPSPVTPSVTYSLGHHISRSQVYPMLSTIGRTTLITGPSTFRPKHRLDLD